MRWQCIACDYQCKRALTFSSRSGEREIFSSVSEGFSVNNDVCGGQQGRYMYRAPPLVNQRVGGVYQLNTSACNAVGYSDPIIVWVRMRQPS